MAEYKKKYRRTEEGKASNQRRHITGRTSGKNIINTLTAEEWKNILERYNFKCAYCDCEFNGDNPPTRDHIIPISKGGHNIKENIVPACKSCNSKKYDKILNHS